jgi:hypothetical protein
VNFKSLVKKLGAGAAAAVENLAANAKGLSGLLTLLNAGSPGLPTSVGQLQEAQRMIKEADRKAAARRLPPAARMPTRGTFTPGHRAVPKPPKGLAGTLGQILGGRRPKPPAGQGQPTPAPGGRTAPTPAPGAGGKGPGAAGGAGGGAGGAAPEPPSARERQQQRDEQRREEKAQRDQQRREQQQRQQAQRREEERARRAAEAAKPAPEPTPRQPGAGPEGKRLPREIVAETQQPTLEQFTRDVIAGTMFEVRRSSNVHSIGFVVQSPTDREGDLFVRFLGTAADGTRAGPGPVYQYKGVPLDLFREFLVAASAGKFVWDHLRVRGTVSGHRFPYELVGIVGDYVPRQAGLRRGQPGEFFLRRTFTDTRYNSKTGRLERVKLTSRLPEQRVSMRGPNPGRGPGPQALRFE